jgi:polyisoprenoid-binding protein YceI
MFVKIIMASIGVIAVGFVALAAGWWFLVREDAQLATDAPEIPAALAEAAAATAEPSAATASETASGVAFEVVSAESEAAYFADEELASLSVPSTAKGATSDVTGIFYLTNDGFALDATQTSSFTVDLTGLTSDEGRRDQRVQDALETGMYRTCRRPDAPGRTATFTVTGVTGVDETIADGETQEFQMTGMLDLHGVQKEITWDVEARREGNLITALATTNFLYADFNIPVLNVGGFVSVEDDVTLQMQIIAQAA